jgi:hypothetical protein
MQKIKIFLISLILILSLQTGASAEYFKDVIVTGTSGLWTDARAYSSLNDAVTAIGSVNHQILLISSPQTVTTLKSHLISHLNLKNLAL